MSILCIMGSRVGSICGNSWGRPLTDSRMVLIALRHPTAASAPESSSSSSVSADCKHFQKAAAYMNQNKWSVGIIMSIKYPFSKMNYTLLSCIPVEYIWEFSFFTKGLPDFGKDQERMAPFLRRTSRLWFRVWTQDLRSPLHSSA